MARFVVLLVVFICRLSTTAIAAENKLQGRIVGGVAADSYPWFTLLTITLKQGGTVICGGSLILPDVILSAAHCWDPASMERILAKVGFRTYQYSYSGQEQVSRAVSNIIVHPLWSTVTFSNDIMLLKVDFPATDVGLAPISYSAPNPGEKVTAVGYGKTREDGSVPNELQQVDVTIIDMNACNGQNSYAGSLNPLNQLCAAGPGKDSCQGDSGGPLLNSEGKIVGITSSDIGCARSNYPGIYTRVGAYQDWLESTLCGLSEYATVGCPKSAPPKPPTRPPTPYTTRPPTRPPTPYPTMPPTMQPTRLPTPYPTMPPTRPPTPYPTMPPTMLPTPYPTMPLTKPPIRPPIIPPTLHPTIKLISKPPIRPPVIPPTLPPTIKVIAADVTADPTNRPLEASMTPELYADGLRLRIRSDGETETSRKRPERPLP